jgi:chemotaxis protein MotA
MLLGVGAAVGAFVAGFAFTGLNPRILLQPASLFIVFGGTLGVTLITAPQATLLLAVSQVRKLFLKRILPTREDLTEEIISYARQIRFRGLVAMEPSIHQISQGFLREALLLAMDTGDRAALQSVLENRIRYCEKQSESAAWVLEVAGGFSPTIGVLGTVIGLISILTQFSSLPAVSSGVAVAFTSTIYGLALANLLLLPAAQRIRAQSWEELDLQQFMAEGALCLFDGLQPGVVRQRLQAFVNTPPKEDNLEQTLDFPLESGRI